ncbi:MAG: type 1 glutamine amidotransferase [Nitrospirae bacterium]|nr:MAG: type 1 glutamine amidotransferase [Nitrospirota bacterium]
MNVLICKNISIEGPGTIEDFLRKNDMPYTTVDLSAGEEIPDTKDFEALVMMGGPMSVNEDDIYPYIKKEEELVREFIAKDKKVFGVCLGAQLMAKALGAKVYAGAEKEIGWYDIELTDSALADPFMGRLSANPDTGAPDKKIKVFHWHGETFNVPEGAVRLAGSELFRNQAFRFGKNAYAFQFHIEVRKEMVYEWLKNESVDFEKIKSDTETEYEVYEKRAYSFYEMFFKDN